MNSFWNFVFVLSQLCTFVISHSSDQKVRLQGAMTDAEAKWGTDVNLSLPYYYTFEDVLSIYQWSFSGISTFAHLPYERCLTNPNLQFDIAIIGAPFDTAVSYRPGNYNPYHLESLFSAQLLRLSY
jgi:hypothetical protein